VPTKERAHQRGRIDPSTWQANRSVRCSMCLRGDIVAHPRSTRNLRRGRARRQGAEFGVAERKGARDGSCPKVAVMNILIERAESLERRMQLLLKACPLVSQPVAQRHRHALEAEILALARTRCVPPKSFPVVALLSCLYDSHDAPSHAAFRPGRAVLKPTGNYVEADAYNALTDLSFLELLLQFPLSTPGSEYVMYTRDKGLASLWSALRPWILQDTAGPTPMFTLDRSLFPGLTNDGASALAGRLESESHTP
jgi:hypothetical protein